MSPTKILRNPERWGGLGVVTEPARCRPLGVQCHFCRNEVHYSLTTSTPATRKYPAPAANAPATWCAANNPADS